MEGYIDLALTKEEVEEHQVVHTPLADSPKYPYGLSISIDEKTLSKLNVDHGDWEVGDIFPVDVILKVTGKNVSESQDGERCCINMQIIAMKGETEEEEAEEEHEEEHEEEEPVESHGYLKHR